MGEQETINEKKGKVYRYPKGKKFQSLRQIARHSNKSLFLVISVSSPVHLLGPVSYGALIKQIKHFVRRRSTDIYLYFIK